jgi:hypothetical protein
MNPSPAHDLSVPNWNNLPEGTCSSRPVLSGTQASCTRDVRWEGYSPTTARKAKNRAVRLLPARVVRQSPTRASTNESICKTMKIKEVMIEGWIEEGCQHRLHNRPSGGQACQETREPCRRRGRRKGRTRSHGSESQINLCTCRGSLGSMAEYI